MIRDSVASVLDKVLQGQQPIRCGTQLQRLQHLCGTLRSKQPVWRHHGIVPAADKQFRNIKYTNERITAIANDSDCVFEVDLHYPDRLHDGHPDYPLAPTKQIHYKPLGVRQQELLEVTSETRQYSHGKKLSNACR